MPPSEAPPSLCCAPKWKAGESARRECEGEAAEGREGASSRIVGDMETQAGEVIALPSPPVQRLDPQVEVHGSA